ncbi:hypothetical protein FISHEDRAFT_61661 [Fistulina hepatica ATCC 64428]|uniref:HMG box domain-containing protein n=1 Tax=Fistulina hepatica ATCC 64428 TaxID=1128425 RepID=A0A0D7A372_9AGAR|nr:hypothetical protein FISHEDRAFT_61661 [Fistulina hepatica ATCC 64428]
MCRMDRGGRAVMATSSFRASRGRQRIIEREFSYRLGQRFRGSQEPAQALLSPEMILYERTARRPIDAYLLSENQKKHPAPRLGFSQLSGSLMPSDPERDVLPWSTDTEDDEGDDMPPLVDNPIHLPSTMFIADDLGTSVATPSIIVTVDDSSAAPPPGESPLTLTFLSDMTPFDPASGQPPPLVRPYEGPVFSTASQSFVELRNVTEPLFPQDAFQGSSVVPHSQRTSEHIPRAPNAFILFRSAFIRTHRVTGKNNELSKLIGKYWKALPHDEREKWEQKAREAEIEHKKRYPDWRFRPQQIKFNTGRSRKKKIKESHAGDVDWGEPGTSKTSKAGAKRGRPRKSYIDQDDEPESSKAGAKRIRHAAPPLRQANPEDQDRATNSGTDSTSAHATAADEESPPDILSPRPGPVARGRRVQARAMDGSGPRTTKDGQPRSNNQPIMNKTLTSNTKVTNAPSGSAADNPSDDAGIDSEGGPHVSRSPVANEFYNVQYAASHVSDPSPTDATVASSPVAPQHSRSSSAPASTAQSPQSSLSGLTPPGSTPNLPGLSRPLSSTTPHDSPISSSPNFPPASSPLPPSPSDVTSPQSVADTPTYIERVAAEGYGPAYDPTLDTATSAFSTYPPGYDGYAYPALSYQHASRNLAYQGGATYETNFSSQPAFAESPPFETTSRSDHRSYGESGPLYGVQDSLRRLPHERYAPYDYSSPSTSHGRYDPSYPRHSSYDRYPSRDRYAYDRPAYRDLGSYDRQSSHDRQTTYGLSTLYDRSESYSRPLSQDDRTSLDRRSRPLSQYDHSYGTSEYSRRTFAETRAWSDEEGQPAATGSSSSGSGLSRSGSDARDFRNTARESRELSDGRRIGDRYGRISSFSALDGWDGRPVAKAPPSRDAAYDEASGHRAEDPTSAAPDD